jgi:hypothetical protein
VTQDTAPIPLAARFGHDFTQVLIYVEPTDDMNAVAQKVAAEVVGKRVRAQDAHMVVFFDGRRMPVDTTVADVGMGRMDFISVDYV